MGSLALLAFTFINLQTRLAAMKADMAAELAGNPFRGLAEAMAGSVQLQWGWAVLVVGSLVLLVAAFTKNAEVHTAIVQGRTAA